MLQVQLDPGAWLIPCKTCVHLSSVFCLSFILMGTSQDPVAPTSLAEGSRAPAEVPGLAWWEGVTMHIPKPITSQRLKRGEEGSQPPHIVKSEQRLPWEIGACSQKEWIPLGSISLYLSPPLLPSLAQPANSPQSGTGLCLLTSAAQHLTISRSFSARPFLHDEDLFSPPGLCTDCTLCVETPSAPFLVSHGTFSGRPPPHTWSSQSG